MHLGGTPGPTHPQVFGNVPFLVKALGFASKKGSINICQISLRGRGRICCKFWSVSVLEVFIGPWTHGIIVLYFLLRGGKEEFLELCWFLVWTDRFWGLCLSSLGDLGFSKNWSQNGSFGSCIKWVCFIQHLLGFSCVQHGHIHPCTTEECSRTRFSWVLPQNSPLQGQHSPLSSVSVTF